MNTISRDQLKQRLEAGEDVTLVEALPKRYYEAGHLPDAINIPHDEICERADELLPDKQASIVVYCASTECQNSAIAARVLQDMGYQQVAEYVEGKQDWKAANLPLEKVTTV